jgi:hypothetical protein
VAGHCIHKTTRSITIQFWNSTTILKKYPDYRNCCWYLEITSQTAIMAGKKAAGENTKKVAGNAKKAEAAAAKAAAENQKKAAEEEQDWSKGAKSNAKK